MVLSQARGQSVVTTGKPSLLVGLGETTDQQLVPFRLESFYGTGWKEGTSSSAQTIAFLSVPQLKFGAHRGLVDVSEPQAHTVYGIPGDPYNWLALYGFQFRPGMTVNEFGEAYEKIWHTTQWLPVAQTQSPLRFPANSVLARVGTGAWFPLRYVPYDKTAIDSASVVAWRQVDKRKKKPRGIWGPRLVARLPGAVVP